MFTKIFLVVLLLSLVGCESETSRKVGGIPTEVECPLTGIQADAELKQLLEQVVPYTVTGRNTLEPEKRFLYNLNKLINEDLAAQSEAYKLAVCKLALRQALAITPTVDSIEVRRNPFHSGTKPPEATVWALGGVVEDSSLWRQDCDNTFGDITTLLFTLQDGSISKVNVTSITISCGGMFSDCCSQSADPPHLDEAWYQNFAAIGREGDFPVTESEYPISAVRKMANSSVKTLDLRYSRISPEGIANLALLQKLESLVFISKTPQHTEAIFELLRKLPNLESVKIESGLVTESQMQKLSECTKLTRLVLTNFHADEPAVLEPINRLKNLEYLSVSSVKEEPALKKDALFQAGGICGYHYTRIGFWESEIAFHDLPNLRHFACIGLSHRSTLSLRNLPNLTTCIADGVALTGDFFTNRMPTNLETLYANRPKMTRKQAQAVASLKQMKALYLSCRNLADSTVFDSLTDMVNLKTLSLTISDNYPRNVFKDAVLTSLPPNLSSLAVRNHATGRLKLALPKLDKGYDMVLYGVEVTGEMPHSPERVQVDFSKMSYEQFQVFKDGSDAKEGFFQFSELVLTGLDRPDLLNGFKFPHRFSINFNRKEMPAALKDKTLHFENCDQVRYLNVGVFDLKDTNIRIFNLPKLRECKIDTNVYQ